MRKHSHYRDRHVGGRLFGRRGPAFGLRSLSMKSWRMSRISDSTDMTDNREFIELYNAGSTAANIGNYTMHYWLLGIQDHCHGLVFCFARYDPGRHDAGAARILRDWRRYRCRMLIFRWASTSICFPTRTRSSSYAPGQTRPIRSSTLWRLDTFRTPELHYASQEQLDQVAHGQTASPTAQRWCLGSRRFRMMQLLPEFAEFDRPVFGWARFRTRTGETLGICR